jgi:hypothetical protein
MNFIPLALPAPFAVQAVSPLSRDNIEIVLASGRRVLVGGHVDVDLLKRVVEALER